MNPAGRPIERDQRVDAFFRFLVQQLRKKNRAGFGQRFADNMFAENVGMNWTNPVLGAVERLDRVADLAQASPAGRVFDVGEIRHVNGGEADKPLQFLEMIRSRQPLHETCQADRQRHDL